MVIRTVAGIVAVSLIALASGNTRTRAADASAGSPPLGAVFPASQSSPEAAAGHFPNVVLWTHEGTRVRFYDDLIKGRVVMINFMFTSCRSQCPLTTPNLVKVEEALGDHLGRNVRMISITVDPATDTPEVLKQFSVRYGTKPGWYFVTGKQRDVDLIRRRLGVLDDAVDKTQHTGLLVYGNESTGQWAATPAMAQPKAIVRSVMRLVDWQKVD